MALGEDEYTIQFRMKKKEKNNHELKRKKSNNHIIFMLKFRFLLWCCCLFSAMFTTRHAASGGFHLLSLFVCAIFINHPIKTATTTTHCNEQRGNYRHGPTRQTKSNKFTIEQ